MSDTDKEDLGSPPPRWVLKVFTRVNVWVYRLSNGKWMNQLEGDPICLVTMKGAKTGKTRTTPLMYVPYENGVILVASQGGAPRHPVWFHNLVAHPDITVEQGGRKMKLHARQVYGEEKETLWPICVEHYNPYETYRQRTDREIPVFVCEPG